MKLFQGIARSDYQDVFRALGFFIDENGYTDVRIVESEDGLVFQGRTSKRRNDKNKSEFDTFLITDAEIKDMVRESYKRRGK